jgi:BASS family bile acid:Na+ symporter
MLKKVLSLYTKFFAIWVVAFGVLAYLWPGVFVKLEECITIAFAVAIEKILPIFPAISVTFVIFNCSLVIARNKDYLSEVTGIILGAGLILNVYGMMAGYGVGSAFRMQTRRSRALAIEIGMKNAGLGTVLALEHFGEKTALPAAVFVFVCIITASAMAAMWQRSEPQENPG